MRTLRETIESELSKKKLTHTYLIQQLQITEPAYYKILKRNSTKTTTLLKIANILEIPVQNLLSKGDEIQEDKTQQNDYWKNKYEESQEKIKHLLNTIQLLSLGKFDSVSLHPAL